MNNNQLGSKSGIASLELIRSMTRIRMIEEEIANRYSQQQMRCPVHLSIGQEASAVGVCSVLKSTDLVFSGHRNHAHYLAKGGSLKKMINEIYGNSTGCSGGRGGSMHLTDLSSGFVASTPIVASTIPIAAGAALSVQSKNTDQVVVVFFGDGAMEAGVTYETLNFAAVKNLPILFVCENNRYSVYSPLSVRQPRERKLCDVAQAIGIKAYECDGNNVFQVSKMSENCVETIRSGGGPHFLELHTYRFREHCGPGFDDDLGYRPDNEVQDWKNRDPLKIATEVSTLNLSSIDIDSIREEIDDAFSSALNVSDLCQTSVQSDVYSIASVDLIHEDTHSRLIKFSEAIREAHLITLEEDSRTILFGLGVPDPKGIFGTTTGLQEKYGLSRVFDMPLAEHAMTGVAVGAAISGMRPILTHQRMDFSLVSIDQLVNQAAKWNFMFNSTMSVPFVIRMIIGRGWGQGPQHSQNLKSWFGHIPGLRVVAPAFAIDAKGMLVSAAKYNHPVVIIEHRWLHDTYGQVPTNNYNVSLEEAHVARIGSDITLIGSSYTTIECMRAAKALKSLANVEAEVVDLRSIRPIDYETICNSVKKTRRVLIIDDSDPLYGLSSELCAGISTRMFGCLDSSPIVMSLPPHPCPTSHHQSKNYYPTSVDVVKNVCKALGKKISEDDLNSFLEISNHDQPNSQFMGPF